MHFKYFKYEEFDSPDIQGSGQMMSDSFIKMLDSVREEYGKPIRINSGYRTEEANIKAGGVSNSSHLKGLAADLRVKNSKERYELLTVLMKYFDRIGVAKSFIHVDIDEDKPQGVIWVY
jgi:zinc D-Ala-D-Ala carboxypeptidase